MQRVGRVAHGRRPLGPPDAALHEALAVIAASGRDPADIGLDGHIRFAEGDLGRVRSEAEAWAAASHITVHTMRPGARTATPIWTRSVPLAT